MTPDEVNHSQAGNVFMLGVGGVFGRYSKPETRCFPFWALTSTY